MRRNNQDAGKKQHEDEEMEEVPARPPIDLPADILARPDKSELPILRGVVACPLYSPSGVLHLKSGYSPHTERYHLLGDLETMRRVNRRPSVSEVKQARELVKDLFGDFPFTSDAEYAHAVAAMLQPFLRLMITGPTPLYLIEKPAPGTGGSLLAHVICHPSMGRFPAGVTQPPTEVEWRYLLFALLRSGPSCILIDNLNGPLVSSALASALTDISYRDRILGSSDAVSVAVHCLWLAAGNNPTLSAEIARRVVRIRLDAGIEHPDTRHKFRHKDLRGWVAHSRSELVWACLTLIQTWIAAGRPAADVAPFGSYEGWTKVIGGVLMVAGIDGFLANREEVRSLSVSESPNLMPFLLSWWELHQDRPVGATDLVQIAGDLDLGGGDDRATGIRLGKWLRTKRNCHFGDFTIKNVGQDQHAQRYQLERVGGNGVVRQGWKVIDIENF